jgi:hypothetical protein
VTGGGWSPDDLFSIALWTAVGLFVATRRFRAEPGLQEQGGSRRRALARFSAGS